MLLNTLLLETIADCAEPRSAIIIAGGFDEFHVDIRAGYRGLPIVLPGAGPDAQAVTDTAEGQQRLAGFLIRRLADRVSVRATGQQVTTGLRHNH